jgi:VIT1/CCC1 family predicted Fe2+/Mn2+ transporter
LIPWFFTRGTVAELLSVLVAAVAAICVGVALSVFTGRSAIRSAARQLLVTSLAAAVTFGIGRAVGAGTVA